LADAEATATRTRSQGDAEAAKYYAVFEKNPELASFLLQLTGLESLLKEKTTLILDTTTPPLQLLKEAGQLTPLKPNKNAVAGDNSNSPRTARNFDSK
jgi:membrane protease subunit HflC